MASTGRSTSTSTTKKSPADVGEYIAAAPPGVQPKLRELRATIREVAPNATEKMSYGIPFYEYGAKPNTFASRLIYFAAQKHHIAIYPAGGQKGLDRYLTERSTLRFPLDKPLPMAKIRALIRARMKEKEVAMSDAKATRAEAASRPSPSARSAR